MPTIPYSRRRFLYTSAGLSLAAQPLMAKGGFQSELKIEAPVPWAPKLKAPQFLGQLGEHLFQPGTLTVVLDGLFTGPMDFGMNMVNEMAIKRQLPTVVFDYTDHNTWSLECSLTALQTGIDYGRIYFARMGDATALTNYEWMTVKAAEKTAANSPLGFFFRNSHIGRDEPYPIRLLDEGFVTISERAGRRPPALIVVDNLIKWDSYQRRGYYHPSLTKFLSSLKSSAEFYGAAVIVGADHDLTTFDDNDDCRSTLTDVMDSETILPHADAVLVIHRDHYVTATGPGRRGVADIIVAENRHGPTGTVEVAFAEKVGTLSSL